jgi:hypothetical protein
MNTDVESPVIELLITNTNVEVLECPICFESENNKKIMPCCSNQICINCFEEWHSKHRSAECVFCRFSVPTSPSQNSTIYTSTNSDNIDNKMKFCVIGGVFMYGFIVLSYYYMKDNCVKPRYC